VVFSSPTEGEVDVPIAAPVRVQFSRGLNPDTVAARIRVSYAGGVLAGDQPAPAVEFTHVYDPATRAIEIRFTRPLDRYRTVRIELLEGVRTFDGAPVTPWTLTFSAGG
jgi:hypothetical protein